MTFTPDRYARKTYEVNAVQVTDENINEVALWCASPVLTETISHPDDDKVKDTSFIKVKVKSKSPTKVRAYYGDWVLELDGRFKAFTDVAFRRAFEPVTDEVSHRDAVTGRYVSEETAEANPGTTVSETN